MAKKQKSEMIIAMQLIGMERFEESVNENIMKDKDLLLAMNSVEDVLGHFQWKKSKLMTEAIDRFIVPRLENFDNLDNVNASFLKWKEKWLEFHDYLSEKDPERMLELEEQYDESGENSELEEMTLPPEFDWEPVDYTTEQWQDIADLQQQSQGK
ncbi:MAG: hypothetical protein FWF63_11150 [Fibromonadales bacterium]|nr:hypothetical protein [Fibromonadales bacterium]